MRYITILPLDSFPNSIQSCPEGMLSQGVRRKIGLAISWYYHHKGYISLCYSKYKLIAVLKVPHRDHRYYECIINEL
jgi:hypothetical protein